MAKCDQDRADTISSMRARARRTAAAVAACVLVSACGSTQAGKTLDAESAVTTMVPGTTESLVRKSPPQQTWAPSAAPVVFDERGAIEAAIPTASAHLTLVALTEGETQVFGSPGSPEPMMTLPATTILGTQTVLGIVEIIEDWALVRLPVRPNGSTGWVKTSDIRLYTVNGKIVVDLSTKSLTYFVNGVEVLTATIAVGSSRNPTPTGTFFVTDSVELGYPDSPWGPHALGLSAYSETITEYNGGPGIIGIHGTNKPGSIGKAASLGCVRMPNDVITALYGLVEIGTPVEIRA